MLGRDVTATWLNYLANNQDTIGECIGDVDSGDGTNSPREFLDAAIDWLQQFASTTNGNPIQNVVFDFGDGKPVAGGMIRLVDVHKAFGPKRVLNGFTPLLGNPYHATERL